MGVFLPPGEGRQYSDYPHSSERIAGWYDKFAFGKAQLVMTRVSEELDSKPLGSGHEEYSFEGIISKCLAQHPDLENILVYFASGGDGGLERGSIERTTVAEYGEDAAYEKLCAAMNRVGFLILVLENRSASTLQDVTIRGKRHGHSAEVAPTDLDTALWFDDEQMRQTFADTLFVMPNFFPDEQVVVVLMAYWSNESGFGGPPLTTVDVPASISFVVGDSQRRVAQVIRPPLKDKAARLALPFGWYRQ